MTIRFTFTDGSLGTALVAASDRGVCCVLLGDSRTRLTSALASEFPDACSVRDDVALRGTAAAVGHVLDGLGDATDVVLDLRGTVFQVCVWDALREIPRGSTASYSEIAERIGAPTAVRAVAGACAANHVAVIVPCHRVVRSDGALGGYKWGIERKRALLDSERAAAPPLIP